MQSAAAVARLGKISSSKLTQKAIRFVRYGCTNRPFYHIVVTMKRRNQHMPVIEQVGSYDPMPNAHNEKLVSINFDRVRYWMGRRAVLTTPVAEVFGLSGFLPIHPRTYVTAWRNRKAALELTDTQRKKEADESKS